MADGNMHINIGWVGKWEDADGDKCNFCNDLMFGKMLTLRARINDKVDTEPFAKFCNNCGEEMNPEGKPE